VQTLTEIRALLHARGAAPRHRFGQNFLHDHNQLRRLVARARVTHGTRVLEVGPGTGTLTESLLESGATVIACEIDPVMIAIVRDRVLPMANGQLDIVEGDCLSGKHHLAPALLAAIDARFGSEPFLLVANLPYQAATPLMLNLLTAVPRCTGLFVTIQREVADRLSAAPGSKSYGPLSVQAQLLARIDPFGVLPPSCFWPAPDVQSALVAIERLEPAPTHDPLAFGRFLQRVFGKRRKQLGSVLGREGSWPDGIVPSMRPEQLTPHQLLALAAAHPMPID
jgi:16S rRNA (adenine1518-N6/adenine1519-N6)-dimethyltransferase